MDFTTTDYQAIVGVLSGNDDDTTTVTTSAAKTDAADDATTDPADLPYPAYVNSNKVAISPNGDEYKDDALPLVMLQRNAKTLQQSIVDADGKQVRMINTEYNGLRHFINNLGQEISYSTVKYADDSVFDGTVYDTATGDYKTVPDGQYYYRMVAHADTNDDETTTLDLPLKVDSTKPEFSDLKMVKKSDGYHLTGQVTDNLSGVNNYSSVAVEINGATDEVAYHLDSAISLDDYIAGNKQATALLTKKTFDIKLQDSVTQYLENAQNQVKLWVDDNAGNEAEGEFHYNPTNNAEQNLLLYNVKDGETVTDNASPYYDANNGTFTIYGAYPKTFYINGQKVTPSADGTFAARIKMPTNTTSLTFALDAKSTRVLKKLDWHFYKLPKVEFEKKTTAGEATGSWGTYSNNPIWVYTNTADYFSFGGNITNTAGASFDGVAGYFYPQTAKQMNSDGTTLQYTLNDAKTTFQMKLKMVADDMSSIDFDTMTEDLFGQIAPGYPGDNFISAYAYVNQDGDTSKPVAGFTDAILIRQVSGDAVNFANVAPDNILQLNNTNAKQLGWDPETNTFKITGTVTDSLAQDLRIYGNSNDPDDPKNVPTLVEDGHGHATFTYNLPITGNDSKMIGYTYVDPSTGEKQHGSFGVIFDTNFPTLKMDGEDKWAVSTKKDVDYEVWTNKSDFTLAGTATDELKGYKLTIDGDQIYRDSDEGVYIVDFNTPDHDYTFSKDLALNADGDSTFTISLADSNLNTVTKRILVHQSTKAPDQPTVKASTTEATAKPVLLTATQDQNDTIQYSLDGGATWQTYTNGVIKGVNGIVQFKAVDKYGNESQPVAYDVTNVAPMIAAKAVATLSDPDEATNSVKVTLGYDHTLTSAEAAITHIKYSLDNGKTWQDYTTPLSVKGTQDILVKTVDDAGNESNAETVHVTAPADAQKVADQDNPTTGKTTDDDPAKGDDAKGSDAKGNDTKGDNAKGDETKGSDAKGNDAKGDDAKGNDAKGNDTKGNDATTTKPAKQPTTTAPVKTTKGNQTSVIANNDGAPLWGTVVNGKADTAKSNQPALGAGNLLGSVVNGKSATAQSAGSTTNTGKKLPQTGEATAANVAIMGMVMLAMSGVTMIFRRKKD